MRPLRTYIYLFFSLSTWFCGNYALAQHNLVFNPSLEEKYECPDNPMGTINLAVHWDSPAFNGGSTDYYDTCSDHINSVTIFNRRKPHSGGSICGFGPLAYEYAEVLLKQPLTSGLTYCVSFYVNRLFLSYATDAIGAHFSKNFLTFPNPPYASVIPVTPQVANPTGNILTDTLNWMKISGSFVAEGGERYMTIGNFVPPNLVNYIYYGGNSPCYYILDDVAVYLCQDAPEPAYAGNDTSICIGDSILLGPVSQPDYEYTWRDENGQVISNFSRIWVKPEQQARFTLEQKDFSFETTLDSIMVSVIPCEDPPPQEIGLVIPNVFTPNDDGYNDYFIIQNFDNLVYRLEMYNRWGNFVYSGDNQSVWDGKINHEPVTSGVYYYTLTVTGTNGKTNNYKGVVHVVR